jgi:hypothetical protein
MLRLLIGLRILRGPKGITPARPKNGKRRLLLGICCVLIASAATHSGAGRAAKPDAIRSPLPVTTTGYSGHPNPTVRSHDRMPNEPDGSLGVCRSRCHR